MTDSTSWYDELIGLTLVGATIAILLAIVFVFNYYSEERKAKRELVKKYKRERRDTDVLNVESKGETV